MNNPDNCKRIIDSIELDELTESLAKQHIYPHVWEGTVKFGLGSSQHRTSILDYGYDPVSNKSSTVPLFISPDVDRPGENSYKIAFPGGQFWALIGLMNLAKSLGIRSQRYDIYSYFSSQKPEPGTPCFKLVIEVDYSESKYTIRQLDWVLQDDDEKNKQVTSWIT